MLPFNIPEIGQSLRILRIKRQLFFKLLLRLLIRMHLPVKVTEAEMNIRSLRRKLCGSFKFRNRLVGPAQAVERLSGKHMSFCRVRRSEEHTSELQSPCNI